MFANSTGSEIAKTSQKSLFIESIVKSDSPNSKNVIGSKGNSIGGQPFKIPN